MIAASLYINLLAEGLAKSTDHNWVVSQFKKGGPIMWPILLVSIVAVAVILERLFWWHDLARPQPPSHHDAERPSGRLGH